VNVPVGSAIAGVITNEVRIIPVIILNGLKNPKKLKIYPP